MPPQLLSSPWGRVRDSQIALPLPGVLMYRMGSSQEAGWCSLGTWIGCGMTLAIECGHYFSMVVFAHFRLVWFILGFLAMHSHLFVPFLTCVYHHLQFASVSRDQTQIVYLEILSFHLISPLWLIVASENSIFSSLIRSATKIQQEFGLSMLPLRHRDITQDIDIDMFGVPWDDDDCFYYCR